MNDGSILLLLCVFCTCVPTGGSSPIPSAVTFTAVLPEVKPVSDYGHTKVKENEVTLQQHR